MLRHTGYCCKLYTINRTNWSSFTVWNNNNDDDDDRRNKTITVALKGSQPLSQENMTQDWRTNLDAFHTEMKTPKLVQDKMKGALKTSVLVHRGFYSKEIIVLAS